MQTLVIIDGFSFFFRAYHAVRNNMTRADGTPTNALFGFAQMLVKVVQDIEPDLCCVALDHPDKTFRHDLYPAYKANRSEMDEEMKAQMPFFTPLIEAFGISALKVAGMEADDIIATLATQYGEKMNVVIVSSDKDLLQLIGETDGGNVFMHDTMKNKTYDADAVVEKFGVGPSKVIEAQALIGDSSDNVPGVPSIGPKTAADLITQFGDLEGIYANLEAVKRDKLREKLSEFKEQAFLSRELVTLKRDIPLSVTPEDLEFDPDLRKAAVFLKQELEFNTLSARVAKMDGQPIDDGGYPPEVTGEMPQNQQQAQPITAHMGRVDRSAYQTIQNIADLKEFISKIKKSSICAIDTETTNINPHLAEIVGVSLAYPQGEGVVAAYVPLAHRAVAADLFEETTAEVNNVNPQQALPLIAALCADNTIKKIAHNFKYDWHILQNAGVTELNNWEDTHLLSFCLNAGVHNHGLDYLADKYLNHKMIPYKGVAGAGQKQVTFDFVPIDKATEYAAEDADVTLRLYNLLTPELTEKPRMVYEEIEKPLMFSLSDMETAGVLVDIPHLQKLSIELQQQIEAHEAKVRELADEPELNVASPKQLGAVLFDKLAIPVKGKSRSTNVTVLEQLGAEYPIAAEILAFRSASKLRSTYTEALMAQVNPKTGRVHTSYNAAGASTGRFSSSDPNLQNIPIRTEAGRKIRHAFIAKPGHVLLAADYSQIELRLLAHFSGSAALTQAFNEGADIHSFTASRVFDVPLDAVEKDQRRVAKILNFGLIYGMGPQAVAKQLDIPKAQAQDYVTRFFARYDGVKDYMEQNKELCRQTGYVETLKGRRIHFPDINSNNGMMKAGAERAAINAPLQGSNADIIKMAMPKIDAKLKAGGYKTKMLLQVHDELVFEVPEGEVETVAPLIQEVMENIVTLNVPLKVEYDVGSNWEDAH